MKPMKLRPVDFSLLAELRNGRNVASNLYRTIDASHQYVNERLTQLEDYGLVDRIGPSPRSGLYEITDAGRASVALRDRYGPDVDFEAMIKEHLDSK